MEVNNRPFIRLTLILLPFPYIIDDHKSPDLTAIKRSSETVGKQHGTR